MAILAPDRVTNPALIAEEAGRALGLIALHIAPMLFYPMPLARITTLVVGPDHRRRGIGRRLVEAAAAVASDAGCDTLELTTGLHREDAHAFYQSLSFCRAAFGMVRPIA
jgi:GNAT superfamily N-acetyltransferase